MYNVRKTKIIYYITISNIKLNKNIIIIIIHEAYNETSNNIIICTEFDLSFNKHFNVKVGTDIGKRTDGFDRIQW